MILNVPSADDFRRVGIEALNMAWDTALRSEEQLEEAHLEEWDDDGSVSDAYWRASAMTLGNGVALLLQGCELLLKARVADCSPYLLLQADSSKWPAKCDTQDIEFALFRTADSSELLRIVDTVSAQRLAPSFGPLFNELRSARNRFIHGVERERRFAPGDIVKWTLQANDYLNGTAWPSVRSAFLDESRESIAFGTDYDPVLLAMEIDRVIGRLSRAEAERFLALPRRAVRAFCPHCLHDAIDFDAQPKTGYLHKRQRRLLVSCITCELDSEIQFGECECGDGAWAEGYCVRCASRG